MKKTIIAASILLIAGFQLFANDGSYVITHTSYTGTAMPISNPDIVMMNEKIELDIYDMKYYISPDFSGLNDHHFGDYKITTKCKFTFKNESSKALTVLMGYPVVLPEKHVFKGQWYGDWESPIINVISYREPDFIKFESMVNGKTVAHTFTTHQTNPQVPEVENYDGVYLFEVHFKAHEEKIIENDIVQLHNRVEYAENTDSRYILTTGNTWARPIGDAEVTISFSGLPDILFLFNPKTYKPIKISENKYRYSFRNFLPKEDIVFNISLGINDPARLKQVLQKYIDAKNYDDAMKVFDFIHLGKITTQNSGITPEFLRIFLFNAGNYYYFKNEFKKSGRCFFYSYLFSSPGIAYTLKTRPDSLYYISEYLSDNRFFEYLYSMEDKKSEYYKQYLSHKEHGPAYYSLYNLACVLSIEYGKQIEQASKNSYLPINFDEMYEFLKMAIDFGFPEDEYDHIRKDTDLKYLFKHKRKEIEQLLK